MCTVQEDTQLLKFKNLLMNEKEEILSYRIIEIISEIIDKQNKNIVEMYILEKLKKKELDIIRFFNTISDKLEDHDSIERIKRNIMSKRNLFYNIKIVEFDSLVIVIMKIGSITERYFLSKEVYQKILNSFTLLKRYFSKYLFRLLCKYRTLWHYQCFLSKQNLLIFKEELNCELECFSSPLYRVLPKYCSMFDDTDSLFGSLGNFFSLNPYKFPDGMCMEINPPFIDQVIEKTIEKILEFLETEIPFSFILSLPVWTNLSINLYSSRHRVLEIDIRKIKCTLYTKYFQEINYYKCNIMILIVQNEKGSKKYPVTSNFLQKFLEYNIK